MPPHLASLVFLVGVVGLFFLDRDRARRSSLALWIPVAWLAIGGSRNVSVWLGNSGPVSADQYLEGSPLDRALLTALIVIGLGVLISRGQRTGEVLRRNAPLVVFFMYCAASALWSDFPLVAFKRWTKVLGNVVMVLVVLTELDPAYAVKRFLSWTAYLLIPASVLIIKYYPDLGRYYDRWEGTAYFSGVTTDKNLLGGTCLVLGLGIVLRLVETFRAPSQERMRQFFVIGAVLGMNLWLFHVVNSATSLGCFLVGSVLIVMLGLFKRARPWVVHLSVLTLSVVGVISYVFPSAFALIVESVGRKTNLTGRTDLWADVLVLDRHPWFGAGFESFFLGQRLEVLWAKYWWHPNEAHNGFLETYLTLGIVGLCLLAILMITGYRQAMKLYKIDPRSGSLRLAFLVIAPIYNLTEAAFKVMNPVWILFLLAVTALPEPKPAQLPEQAATDAPRGLRREPATVPPEGKFGWLRPSAARHTARASSR